MPKPKELSPVVKQMIDSKKFAMETLGIEDPDAFIQQRKSLQERTKPEDVEVGLVKTDAGKLEKLFSQTGIDEAANDGGDKEEQAGETPQQPYDANKKKNYSSS